MSCLTGQMAMLSWCCSDRERAAAYVVSDPATGQIYSLKHVLVRKEKDRRFIDQLETEYEIGRRVNHIGLRRTVHLKYERTLLRQVTSAGLVMEFFDGVPLDRHIVANVPDMVDCLLQTSRAARPALLRVCSLRSEADRIFSSTPAPVKVIDLGQACPIGTKKHASKAPPTTSPPSRFAANRYRCTPTSTTWELRCIGC